MNNIKFSIYTKNNVKYTSFTNIYFIFICIVIGKLFSMLYFVIYTGLEFV